MNLEAFIEKFAEQFFDTDREELGADTKFKELEEYGSLTALSIIAMIDAEYGVTLRGTDILRTDTIEDLFNLVEEMKK